MSSLTARLRFLLANPQPVPLLAAALSLGVVVMQLMLLPAQETLEEETGAAIVRTERLIRRAQIEGRERALQPAEQRQCHRERPQPMWDRRSSFFMSVSSALSGAAGA